MVNIVHDNKPIYIRHNQNTIIPNIHTRCNINANNKKQINQSTLIHTTTIT